MSSITLWGAVYDTDHVDLPKTGGGTVRFSEGGGGNAYTRTVVCPQQTVTPTSNGTYYAATLTGATALVDGDDYIVTFDDTEWYFTCCNLWNTYNLLGDQNYMWDTVDQPYPFCIIWESGTTYSLVVNSATSRTVKVEKIVLSGSPMNLTTKTITQNGTYDAEDDSADGYSSVTVNVSSGASYDGVEVVYDSNGKVTDYVFHMENIPQYVLNNVQGNRQPSDGVAEISFATKPTHIGKGAFLSAKCQIDWSNLDELMYIGEYAFSTFRSNGYDGSSDVVNLPKFVGYYNATYSAASVFRANSAYTPKIYNLPVCTIIPQYAWYQCAGSGWDITIGSVGHAVTESKQQPFGGNTGIAGTCTIYTTGDKVDTLNTAVQNGAGAGLVFVFKASEATTYGGNSYAAGATMLTA